MIHIVALGFVGIEILVGVVFVWNPRIAIEMQTVLSRMTNWSFKPVSEDVVCREMRGIGFFLIVIGVLAAASIINMDKIIQCMIRSS